MKLSVYQNFKRRLNICGVARGSFFSKHDNINFNFQYKNLKSKQLVCLVKDLKNTQFEDHLPICFEKCSTSLRNLYLNLWQIDLAVIYHRVKI